MAEPLTHPRSRPSSARGTLVFVPYPVQRGRGPHLGGTAHAVDAVGDTFWSDIRITGRGVEISDTGGRASFAVCVRWNVEDFGYLYLVADGAGHGYDLPEPGEEVRLNLPLELARSRVARNRLRRARFGDAGWAADPETRALTDLSEELLEAAEAGPSEPDRASLAQRALRWALEASEAMELAWARYRISGFAGPRPMLFGADARSFYHMDADLFLERFARVFDYATVTHYTRDTTAGLSSFEPEEGRLQFDTRDLVVDRMLDRGIAVEGRPLFWPHVFVTPDWLRAKSFDQLKLYVERHVRRVMAHYGDRLAAWEIVNELHDWANEVAMTPDQSVEITKLACETALDVNPRVERLINNCCPFAEYVQLGKWTDREALHPQRTSRRFMQALVDAEVPFTLTGTQMYFPTRDLQDIILRIESFEAFGRPVHLTEVGAASSSRTPSDRDGTVATPDAPPAWRGHWDETLQADWLEGLYTLAYSRPFVRLVTWYDVLDGQTFIPDAGLIRSVRGDTKAAFDRLVRLQQAWGVGPAATP
jgi:hypothetical protein